MTVPTSRCICLTTFLRRHQRGRRVAKAWSDSRGSDCQVETIYYSGWKCRHGRPAASPTYLRERYPCILTRKNGYAVVRPRSHYFASIIVGAVRVRLLPPGKSALILAKGIEEQRTNVICKANYLPVRLVKMSRERSRIDREGGPRPP